MHSISKDSLSLLDPNIQYNIFGLTNISGDNKSALYQFLTDQKTNPIYGSPVTWNFVKFLINRKGEVINRFSTITKPSSSKIKDAIKEAL